jgi:FkbM family methyltransferase
MTFFSQCGQDEILEKHIFKGFKNGVFVDVGAHDGVTYNNTLFFEKNHEWIGLNIEPIPSVFQSLVQNRPSCINLECAVTDTNGSEKFVLNTGYTEMLSGLERFYKPEWYQRRDREISMMGGGSMVVDVQTRTLKDIFRERNVDRVHLLSIDVEGGELGVINGIDFSEVKIDVILFEANDKNDSNTRTILKNLNEQGYVRFEMNLLDIIMIHKDSQFFPSTVAFASS